MKRKTWFLTLFFLAILVLAVDYVFLHLRWPNQSGTLATESPVAKMKTDFPEGGPKVPENFAVVISDCIKDLDIGRSATPAELFQNLEKKYGLKNRIIVNENIHYKTTSGTNKRMQIHVDQESGEPKRQMQIFTVGPGEIPVQESVSVEESTNPTDEVLRKYLGDATVVYHQLKETWLFGKNIPAMIEWINNQPGEFQMAIDRKNFSCTTLTCSCR